MYTQVYQTRYGYVETTLVWYSCVYIYVPIYLICVVPDIIRQRPIQHMYISRELQDGNSVEKSYEIVYCMSWPLSDSAIICVEVLDFTFQNMRVKAAFQNLGPHLYVNLVYWYQSVLSVKNTARGFQNFKYDTCCIMILCPERH